MRESALEVVSMPARMDVLQVRVRFYTVKVRLVSTHDVCERISSSVICSEGVAAMFALTTLRD